MRDVECCGFSLSDADTCPWPHLVTGPIQSVHIIEQDHEQRNVIIGQAAEAMVLNGLGFINQRLYLVPQFFENIIRVCPWGIPTFT